MRYQLSHTYEDIVSPENLLAGWEGFARGKRSKPDVREFERHLMDNLMELHETLADKSYRHGVYQDFHITDPKPRHIHKAPVRDRVVHHAVHRILYPFFDKTFIFDSYSCRAEKGVHRALERFASFGRKASRNNTRSCRVLQCDIRRFFESVDQYILLGVLATYIPDRDVL